MMHKNRRHAVSEVATAEELAEKLTQHDWTGCTGFRLNGLLFLNDATSGDGAQEYGVFRDGKQIESVTFSWCTQERALELIREYLNGGGVEPFATLGIVEEASKHGTCHHCA